jgi:ATP-binding cassette subfamily F protein uup
MGDLMPLEGEIKQAEQLKIQYFSQNRDCLKEDKTPYELLGDGQDMIHLPDGRSQHVISYFESFLFRRDDIHRPLKYFSGGERGRLQMAMNLKQAGDVWIFDEPTNDLDLETLQILESKLDQFDGVLLLISHDRSFLETVTNRIWVIEENKKITLFEAGYAHAAPYLEALALERELQEDQASDNPPNNSSLKEAKDESSNKKLTKR